MSDLGWQQFADRLYGKVQYPAFDGREPQDITDLVSRDLAVRKRVGMERYGVPLRTTPGPTDDRDWLAEAYEECLDQAVYLRKAIAVRDAERDGN